jgi:hypothetical protein
MSRYFSNLSGKYIHQFSVCYKQRDGQTHGKADNRIFQLFLANIKELPQNLLERIVSQYINLKKDKNGIKFLSEMTI